MSHALGSRAQQAGAWTAAATAPWTFQRTLMPRSTLDQGLVTGLTLAVDYALGALVQELVESASLRAVGGSREDEADDWRWRRASLIGDGVAVAVGLALQKAFAQRPREPLPRGAVRTGGWWLAVGGLAGGVVGLLQEGMHQLEGDGDRDEVLAQWRRIPVAIPAGGVMAAVVEYRRRRAERGDAHLADAASEDWHVSAGRSIGIGLGVTGALIGVSSGERVLVGAVGNALSAFLPGDPRFWRPVGHLAVLAGLSVGVRALLESEYAGIETSAEKLEAAYEDAPDTPLCSGGPGSLVSYDTLSRQGCRYVNTYLRPEHIDATMGETSAINPIRVFVGLDSAAGEVERVDLAIAELERTGAFDRDLLMVISPTGTGYVNYVAVEATEYLSRGNVASVVVQYSMRPSALSLDRVKQGRHHYRMLVRAIHERIEARGGAHRPQVVLFGESLGAQTSQDAFMHGGTDALVDRGVDRAIWIGTPYFSKWKEEVLYDNRPDTDRSLIGVFDHFGELQALEPEARERLRFVMITHDNDAVTKMGPDLLLETPTWLGPPETRARRVPESQKYRSPMTFFQTLVDMKNSMNVVPGVLAASGHDYRADLSVFVREVYDLPCSDEQLEAVERALRQSELERKQLMDEHTPSKPPKTGLLARLRRRPAPIGPAGSPDGSVPGAPGSPAPTPPGVVEPEVAEKAAG